MNSKRTKVTLEELKNLPIVTIIVTIITVLITTVTITYGVINALLIEHYKLEIQRLEKLLDQQKTVEDLNNIAASMRKILEMQNSLIDSLKKDSKASIDSKAYIENKIRPSKWDDIIYKINKSIEFANSTRKMDPTDTKTLDKYYSWRSQTISIIKSVDNELKTNYENDFENLTKLLPSDYQQLRTKISDGILILEAIKNFK